MIHQPNPSYKYVVLKLTVTTQHNFGSQGIRIFSFKKYKFSKHLEATYKL